MKHRNGPKSGAITEENTNKTGPNPRWETAILFFSFVGLCVWYFGRQAIFRVGAQPSPWWHLIPAVFLVLLIWVLVRRARRATVALKEADPARRRNWN